MLTFDDLLEYYDDYFAHLDRQLFKQCLDEFVSITGIKFKTKGDNYMHITTYIKRYFIYESEYVDLWFNILKNHNYNMKSEMRDVIHQLTYLRFPNFNKRLIKKLLHSPVVDDISYREGLFTIESSEYGRIEVMLAKDIFQDVKPVMKYIKRYELPTRCHDHAYFLSVGFPDFYSIISLCNHQFNHPFYHSYSYYSEVNTVFDLTLKCGIVKPTFDLLMEPKEIMMIPNNAIPDMLKQVIETTDQPEKRCELLKIVLPYQLEHLSDEEKKRILDYKNSLHH